MKRIFAALMLVLCLCGCASCAEKAILVTQPAYPSMSFYIYKPVNVPKAFYATFDGYLVYKNSIGVWLYGVVEKGKFFKTEYVVGSVVPSTVKMTPYKPKLSSVAPILGTDRAAAGTTLTTTAKSPRIVYMPPASGLELRSSEELSHGSTDWTQNSNFMAIGKWQKSIDRIGVTYRPSIPVAWKGDNPEVIYAWTGLQWRQLEAKPANAPALSTLRRGIYDLTRHVRQVNIMNWTDDDTHVLSQYSVMWGYQWLGQIFLTSEVWR